MWTDLTEQEKLDHLAREAASLGAIWIHLWTGSHVRMKTSQLVILEYWLDDNRRAKNKAERKLHKERKRANGS